MDCSSFAPEDRRVASSSTQNGSRKLVACKNYATQKCLFQETGLPCSENLSRSDRFVIYKTGSVCWINVSKKKVKYSIDNSKLQHGMGTPSLSIMLIESLKLMHHAKAKDVKLVKVHKIR